MSLSKFNSRHRLARSSEAALSTENCLVKASNSGKISVALIFPNSYNLGISNLGFQTAHRIAAQTPGVAIERFFLSLDGKNVLKPPFYSLETGRPLGDFDILAFSISFECDFDSIPVILGPLGIPIKRCSRQSGRYPLLIVGGAAVASNPHALSDIFEILVPGEAETTWQQILLTCIDKGRDEISFSGVSGIWLPSVADSPEEAVETHKVSTSPAFSHIVSTRNVFGGAPIIEVMRGCPGNCPFCLARSIYYPARPVSCESLKHLLQMFSDYKQIALVAPSLFDHPEVAQILELLAQSGIRLRNSSVKWEKLSDELLDLLWRCGVRGLTLAPESGSERLRRLMSKNLDEDSFIKVLESVWRFGFNPVKLYFIVGIESETDEDLKMTADFVAAVGRAAAQNGKTISANFSGLVPKRRTAWENSVPSTREVLKERFNFLRRFLKNEVPDVKCCFESPLQIARQRYLAHVGSGLAEEYDQEIKLCRERGVDLSDSRQDWEF